jgi:hypothetical protein
MFTLFKLLKSLKEPNLSKAEWGTLVTIFNTLSEKNFSQFEPHFLKYISDNKIIFAREPNSSILRYMETWFSIIDELNHLNKIIDEAKNLHCGETVKLTDNDLALIIVSLLPTDQIMLRDMSVKIELTSRISIQDRAMISLLKNFIFAISWRISQLDNKTMRALTNTLDNQQIQAIVQESYNRFLINKTIHLCNNYKNSLAKNIGLYLRNNDKLACLYYFDVWKIKNIHTLIKWEFESISFDAGNVNLTPLLKSLFTKYSHVDDLLISLKDTKMRTDDILLLFAEKFNVYRDIFNKKVNEQQFSLFSSYTYSDEELEANFINNCNFITNEVISASSYAPS